MRKKNMLRDIKKKSTEATVLIDYMWDISEAKINPGYKDKHIFSNKNRVMTTMSPSTKDRLKKNLETFSSDKRYSTASH